VRQTPTHTEHQYGSLQVYLKEIGNGKLLSREEERDLALKIKQGDEEARSKMIRANLKLVVKIAMEYANYGLAVEDLISEGNIGLMKAVERFDGTRGVKFCTYASWWIKQGVKRALANQSKTIRLPVHIVDKLAKIRRATTRLQEILGREPTDDEISEEMGIPSHKISELKIISLRPSSLDAPMSVDEDNSSLGEHVADEACIDPAQFFGEKALRDDILEILSELDERERQILVARFGLDGSPPMTLEIIGWEWKITRERVRQLQNSALCKIRTKLEGKETVIPSPEISDEYEVNFVVGEYLARTESSEVNDLL
jgi:RNA polymerase primary sigma factor